MKNRGYTLIDLMAVTAIMMIFGTALFGTFSTLRVAFVRQNTVQDVNRSARLALERIVRDAKEAVQIETAHDGNTSADDVLVLRLPSIDNNGEPTDIDTDFDYVSYYLDEDDPTLLVREVDVGNGSTRNGGADAEQIIAMNIDTLLFSEDETGLSDLASVTDVKRLNIQIRAEGTTGQSHQVADLDSDVVLRNKL